MPPRALLCRRLSAATVGAYTQFELEPMAKVGAAMLSFRSPQLAQVQDQLAELDIVLVQPETELSSDKTAHLLGVIKHMNQSETKFTLEAFIDQGPQHHKLAGLALQQQPRMKLTRIDSLLTTMREFEALRYLGGHQLLPCILRGEFKPMRSLAALEERDIAEHVSRFKHKLNDSQQLALRCVAL